MSKGQRLREQSTRQRIAAQQAAARRADIRRRAMILGGSLVAVIAVVVGLVIAYSTNSPGKSTAGPTGTVLPASVAANVTSVPTSALASVGGGSVPSYTQTTAPLPPISGSALTAGGKPEMLYIGAEYCPYCAAMRWSMAVALNRFGHFTTPLRGIHSSPIDVFPNTATLTFYKAQYSSSYLTFTPVENLDVNKKPLQNLTSAQHALWVKYDTTNGSQGYPFIDFGNTSALKGPIYDPGVLKGLTWAQIAADLHNPSSPVAQSVLGAANYVTAAICKMTNNKPASVCSASSITKLEAGI
jgi:thiol-disulfide isomerase/thioredoxin